MHLLIPFATALQDAAAHTLRDLALPNLQRLLNTLEAGALDSADEYSLSAPHERALAAAWGWRGDDGTLPFAARLAAADGIATGERAWGLLTPVHWQVGREHITLADPSELALDDAESRTVFAAIRELFESLGWTLAYAAASRWYAAHDSLADMPCASIDRVIGRNIDLWLTPGPKTRLLRRLQNEVQMLLYQHPLNDERTARGALPVNSFWISGCGAFQPADERAVTVDDRLRAPLLAADWPAWADAWRALDAEVLATLLPAAERGEGVALTLCGERSAQRFDAAPRSAWQKLGRRFKAGADPAAVLERL